MTTVGVGVGGASLQVVLLDDGGELAGITKLRTPRSGDHSAVVEVLVAGVQEVMGDAGVDADEVAAIGVGVPGAVLGGTVGQAVNVPGWTERFSLAEMLEARLATRVRVMNDVTAVAVGEHRRGAGRGHDDLMVVWVGTGVGSGLIVAGRIYEGAFGVAGEFGHTVVEIGGAVCPCGRRGCVEAYAGQRALENAVTRSVDAGRSTSLFRIAEEGGADRLTPEVFRAALDEGDTLAADLIDAGARALGKGIASAVNLLDVEAVVIAGGFADELGPRFIDQIDAEARTNLFLQPPRVRIRAAELGPLGAAIGAALLAAEAADGPTPT